MEYIKFFDQNPSLKESLESIDKGLTYNQQTHYDEARSQLRKEIVVLMSKFEFEISLKKSRELVKISKTLFLANPVSSFYSYAVDSLLLVKSLLRLNKHERAEELLQKLWILVKKFYFEFDTFKLEKMIGSKRIRFKIPLLKTENYKENEKINPRSDNSNFDNSSSSERDLVTEVRKRAQLFSTLASLAYNSGDLALTEKCYVSYIKTIEIAFGKESIQASNCYYLVGIYYLECFLNLKAIACFKRCCLIRAAHTSYDDTSLADSYFNIGIAFKFLNKKKIAKEWIFSALAIRVVKTGEESLHVAKVKLIKKRFMRHWG